MKKGLIIVVFFLLSVLTPVSAQNAIDSLQAALQHIHSSKEKTDVYNALSNAYMPSSPDSAMAYARKALHQARIALYPSGAATALGHTGRVHYLQSRLEASLVYYLRMLKIYELIENKEGMAVALNGVGNVYSAKDDREKSLQYYLEAEKISSSSIDNVLINISYNYLALGNDSMALKYREKYLQKEKDAGNPYGMKIGLTNLGEYYEAIGDDEKALDYYQQAREVYADKRVDAYLLRYIGNIYRKKQLFEKALTCQTKALQMFQDLQIQNEIINTWNKLATLHKEQGQTNKAIDYYQKSLELSQKVGARQKSQTIAKALAETYLQINQCYKAYDYRVLAITLKDSVLNDETDSKISEMHARYELEKREQEIAMKNIELEKKAAIVNKRKFERNAFIIGFVLVLILSVVVFQNYQSKKNSNKLLIEKNQEINQQKEEIEVQAENLQKANQQITEKNTQLAQLNATKDKFFSIIAHDLKNPLNSLMLSTEILLQNAPNMDLEHRKRFHQHIFNSAKQGYNLLQNLLQWSRAQTGRIEWQPRALDIHLLVDEAITVLHHTASDKKIRLINAVPPEPEILVYADEDMAKTIIRNLASNAIKFTEKGGYVKVTTQIRNSSENTQPMVVVTVEDNGVGIEPDDTEKLFRIDKHHSTKGTKDESGTGLGLILCREFTERNGGKIWVESTPGKGSRFRFTLPLHTDNE